MFSHPGCLSDEEQADFLEYSDPVPEGYSKFLFRILDLEGKFQNF
jgi:hypothetical protein